MNNEFIYSLYYDRLMSRRVTEDTNQVLISQIKRRARHKIINR